MQSNLMEKIPDTGPSHRQHQKREAFEPRTMPQFSKNNRSFPEVGNPLGRHANGSQKNAAQDSKSSSRNLSHVPCKFFRQGACQAGSSCPFSHATDVATDTAPCKYFQKGNCKFGVKCALAHVLPDGRRINPKSLAQAYQQQHQPSSGSNSNGLYQLHQQQNRVGSYVSNSSRSPSSTISRSIGSTSNSNPTSTSNFSLQQINTNGLSQPINISENPDGSQVSQSPHRTFIGSNNSPIATSPFANSIWSNPQSAGTSVTAINSNLHSTSVGSHENFGNTNPTTPTNSNGNSVNRSSYYRTLSHNAILRPSFLSSLAKKQELMETPMFLPNQHQPILDGSAIADDDDDDQGQLDFVPSSLSDLLTPQELKRRNSRPPSTAPTPNFGQRTGSGSAAPSFSSFSETTGTNVISPKNSFNVSSIGSSQNFSFQQPSQQIFHTPMGLSLSQGYTHTEDDGTQFLMDDDMQ